MLPPPVNIDPRQKDMIDALVDAQERKRAGRQWVTWLTVLAVSLAGLYAFNHGFVSGWLGNTLAIVGIVGIFLFLAFLSTLPFGRGDSSFKWWWLR
jgi:hypothetical protein